MESMRTSQLHTIKNKILVLFSYCQSTTMFFFSVLKKVDYDPLNPTRSSSKKQQKTSKTEFSVLSLALIFFFSFAILGLNFFFFFFFFAAYTDSLYFLSV